MKIRLVLISFVVFYAVGCASKTIYWTHKDHGRVESTDPVLVADREACQAEAYKQGLTINGVVYTDRNIAFGKITDDVLRKGKNAPEPEYWPEFSRLEKQAHECFVGKGWFKEK